MERYSKLWSDGIEARKEKIKGREEEVESMLSQLLDANGLKTLHVVLTRIAPHYNLGTNTELTEQAVFALSVWDTLDTAEKLGVFDLGEAVLQMVAVEAVEQAMREAFTDDYNPPGYL